MDQLTNASVLVSLTGEGTPSPQSPGWESIWYKEERCDCWREWLYEVDRKVRYVAVYSSGPSGLNIREIYIFGICKYCDELC